VNDGRKTEIGPEEESAIPHLDLLYQGFLSVAEFRDPETGAHLERMGIFSRMLAEKAAGQAGCEAAADPAWRNTLFHAAPLHDIGKIAVPDRILLKPGKLTPSEFEVMKAHTTYGRSLLEGMSRRFRGSVPAVIQMGIEVAACHHEQWGGLGYPQGLNGDAIPLAARIVAIADVYDAITSPRVYRPGWLSHDEAVAYIHSNRGKMFDPGLVDVFISIQDAIHTEAERLADPVPIRGKDGEALPLRPEIPTSILVVDDEFLIRDLLKQYLTEEGYQVETAANVPEARSLLAARSFDLVILDINMPDESGLVLLDDVAPRAPDTMVIMMTALADVRVGVETLKKGAYDYLLKPMDLEELTVAVTRALRHRELALENQAYLTRLELTVAYRTSELTGQLRAMEAELARLQQDD